MDVKSDASARVADEVAPTVCPVCRAPSPGFFGSIQEQVYWKCSICEARFLDPMHWLAPEDEFAHYLHHENDPRDVRYRQFLSKLFTPLLDKLAPSQRGLDYGCGPGPALAEMFREEGHFITLYDPFFYPGSLALAQTYNFITCTEVAEHFHQPADEFDRLDMMLRPGGWLGVMTCFQTDDARFASWHYRKDPTHVVFYREKTLRLIADQRSWKCEFPVKDVALMHKPVFLVGAD